LSEPASFDRKRDLRRRLLDARKALTASALTPRTLGIPEVPGEPHDVTVDLVVTDRRVVGPRR